MSDDMNETEGRNSAYEPAPFVSIDKIYCPWASKRITVDEAKNIYNSLDNLCIECKDCQK